MNVNQQQSLNDKCLNRHWCSDSEYFTGADSLLTLVNRGWDIVSHEIDMSHHRKARQITIVVFELQKRGDSLILRVVNNPFVERLLAEEDQENTIKVER